jgi:hypothetical protein
MRIRFIISSAPKLTSPAEPVPSRRKMNAR